LECLETNGSQMKTSQTGLELIESSEGLSLKIAADNSKQQIGYGHDLQAGDSANYANGITQQAAVALLIADLSTRFEPTLNRLLPPTANQNQYDACADFCYNEGPANFAVMLSHGWDQVPVQMPRWDWEEVKGVEVQSAGLAARRAREVVLFNTSC
jgi:GH24 family phage-related lysozyme (muramidase)